MIVLTYNCNYYTYMYIYKHCESYLQVTAQFFQRMDSSIGNRVIQQYQLVLALLIFLMRFTNVGVLGFLITKRLINMCCNFLVLLNFRFLYFLLDSKCFGNNSLHEQTYVSGPYFVSVIYWLKIYVIQKTPQNTNVFTEA